MALNKVMLIGNVGNDPEIRYLDSNPQSPQGNAKVASFRLATTERYRDRNGETRENTEWHSIVAWRSNADLVEKFVHKGSQIYIEGKLRTRQWTDQTGNKRFTTEVQADNIQLLGKRTDTPQPGQPASGGYQGQNSPAGPYQGQQGYQGQNSPAGNYPAQGSQGGYQGVSQPGYPVQPASGGYPTQAQPGPGFQGQGAQGGFQGQQAPSGPAYATQSAAPDAPDDDLPF